MVTHAAPRNRTPIHHDARLITVGVVVVLGGIFFLGVPEISVTPTQESDVTSTAAPAPPTVPASGGSTIEYHIVRGARFFDILVARVGTREHTVIGETDDMCLELRDQRDYDADGDRDALVFQNVGCAGETAPGLLFFVAAEERFQLSNRFQGHRVRVERLHDQWSVVTETSRHTLVNGRAVQVQD